jgi:hypothetical protein
MEAQGATLVPRPWTVSDTHPAHPVTLGKRRELEVLGERTPVVLIANNVKRQRTKRATIAVANTHPLTDLLRDCAIWPAMSIEAMNTEL